MVGSSKTAENRTGQGPSHVLFAVSPNTNTNTRTPPTAAAAAIHNNSNRNIKKRPLCDPRLDKDYVSKRQRAHQEFSGWTSSSNTTTTTKTTTTPWDGVSGFEQELVKCCQELPDDYYESDEEDNNYNNNDVDDVITDDKNVSMMLPSIGGVLAVEKETRFAALLSSRCHTMASKCLAMAILERTLEAYLEEKAERTAREQNSQTTTTTTTTTTPDVDAAATATATAAASASEHKSNRRFRLFFAAGGLRILNQWLAEASSYETKNNKSIDGSFTEKKASTTRPIALSILLFLQHIPFDKKTVTNSKINKQVQKLGKKVASIREAHQNQLALIEEEEDLNLWTIQNKSGESLAQIIAAIDAVKASWREKSKEKKQQHTVSVSADPFGPLQSKIRERLKIWNNFEARNEKPDWYRSRKRKASTEAERILQTKIKQMQSRSQKSLKQLREKLRMQQQHSSANNNNNNKTVKWRDASNREHQKQKQLLEDVIVFEKDLPPSSVGTDPSV